MAETMPDPPRRAVSPLAADVLVRQPRDAGVEYFTPMEVDTAAWRYAVLGWSVWRIRAALGLETLDDVTQCLTRYQEANTLTESLKRAVMVGQLDDAIQAVIDVSKRDHYKFHKGMMIMMPVDPSNPKSELVPVVDDGAVLDAAKTLAVLLDRKARLEGLDAPEKHEHQHTLVPLPAPAQQWLDDRRARTIEGTAN